MVYILCKPGKLDAHEMKIMETHSIIGYDAFKSATRELERDPFLQMCMDIILYHHEKWDGSGYPMGLLQEDIPLSARIVTICDYYDALTTKRHYKDIIPHKEALKILEQNNLIFDPTILGIFLDNEEEFNRIRKEFSESEEILPKIDI